MGSTKVIFSPSPLLLPRKGECDSHLRLPFSWQLPFHWRCHRNARYFQIHSKNGWYPVFNFLSFAMKETRFFKMKWCEFADLLDLTLWFLMISSRRCIIILKTRLLLPSTSLFWLCERERSVKMLLHCAYSRILELITSGNVTLLSSSFNEKTTAGFEGGGVMVLTPKYTFLLTLASWQRGWLRQVDLAMFLGLCECAIHPVSIKLLVWCPILLWPFYYSLLSHPMSFCLPLFLVSSLYSCGTIEWISI